MFVRNVEERLVIHTAKNMTKVNTIDLKGNKYARVPKRLKAFREENPRSSIKTTPKMLEDGNILFEAYILRDKSNADSADATGHAIGPSKGDKAFEKLETIAVGRALALLGYLASGEVASMEEMEEYTAYREEKRMEEVNNAISKLSGAESLEELKTLFTSLGGVMAQPEVIAAKNELKDKLSEEV